VDDASSVAIYDKLDWHFDTAVSSGQSALLPLLDGEDNA